MRNTDRANSRRIHGVTAYNRERVDGETERENILRASGVPLEPENQSVQLKMAFECDSRTRQVYVHGLWLADETQELGEWNFARGLVSGAYRDAAFRKYQDEAQTMPTWLLGSEYMGGFTPQGKRGWEHLEHEWRKHGQYVVHYLRGFRARTRPSVFVAEYVALMAEFKEAAKNWPVFGNPDMSLRIHSQQCSANGRAERYEMCGHWENNGWRFEPCLSEPFRD